MEALASALRETRVLSLEDAQQRAAVLHADLEKLKRLHIELLPFESVPHSPGFCAVLIQYRFGSVPFTINKAELGPGGVKKQVIEMDGTGLDREELLYFSQVSEIGHRCIPHLWLSDSGLRHTLELPTQHLDTLNEVWWLARWNGIQTPSVTREAKLIPGKKKSVDWRFEIWPIWTVNLEIKHLVRSLADRVYGKKHQFWCALRPDGTIDSDDPSLKFRPSSANEINVLAVTWYDQISEELEGRIQAFLDATDRIDAVVIWSVADRRRNGWRRFFPRFRELESKRRALAEMLLEPNPEDHSRIMMQRFPRPQEEIMREVREAGLSDFAE